ncbi:MAG: RNA polymerase-binding protein DksA [Proteobacteria bacterium]|nr:RNA polymerase-binding protein DksA [Pseudomonadota bacterium]
MPVKNTVSKKRKKVSSTRKKAAVKKTLAKKSVAKKTAARKPKVSKKKAASSRKKVSRKKVSAKKPAARKISKKKVSKKKVASKKPGKKKAAPRKAVSKKKAAPRKAVSKKKAAPKKAASKRKSAPKKAVSKKKAAPKKAASKKKAAPKKAARKKKTAPKNVARKATVRKKPVTRKAPPRRPRSSHNILSGPIHGISPYKPLREEEYMSNKQLGHFRNILSAWKGELIIEVDRTVHHMRDEAANFPDPNDRATQESEFGLELRTRDRERKLLRKIESALSRIDDASYGYCDETGEEIGLKRLEARPVATMCVEAQERRELAERQFRDRDDRYR